MGGDAAVVMQSTRPPSLDCADARRVQKAFSPSARMPMAVPYSSSANRLQSLRLAVGMPCLGHS